MTCIIKAVIFAVFLLLIVPVVILIALVKNKEYGAING